MEKLTKDQIKRQDFVDNQIHDLVKRLNPSTREIEWNIEMIGDIRDTIQHCFSINIKLSMSWNFIPDENLNVGPGDGF
jgi:hypothetical protein